MTATGRPLAELAEQIPLLPQEQRAVRVRHKDQWEGDPASGARSPTRSGGWASGGRVLVRPSGTEPALRVMVEGEDADVVAELADGWRRSRNSAYTRADAPGEDASDHVRDRRLYGPREAGPILSRACGASSTGAMTRPGSPS